MDIKVYQIKEIQKTTGLSRNTVMGLIKEGRIKAIRARQRRWIIPGWAFEQFLKKVQYQ